MQGERESWDTFFSRRVCKIGSNDVSAQSDFSLGSDSGCSRKTCAVGALAVQLLRHAGLPQGRLLQDDARATEIARAGGAGARHSRPIRQ